MPLIRSTEARTHTMHGVTFTAHATTVTGAEQLAGWSARFEPHTPGRPHRMSQEEILRIMDGSLAVTIDDEAFTAEAGDCVVVPAGASFCVSNLSDSPATAWVVTTLGMTATMTEGGATISPPWAQ